MSATSIGVVGVIKKECSLLYLRSMGDFIVLGIFCVAFLPTFTKKSLKVFAITFGSDVIFSLESLSLFITFILELLLLVLSLYLTKGASYCYYLIKRNC